MDGRPRDGAPAARRHQQPAASQALRCARGGGAENAGARAAPRRRRAHRAVDGRRLAARARPPPEPQEAPPVSFQNPAALLLLAFVPLTALIYMAAQRRRRRFAVRFTNMELLGDVVSETPSWRRHIPPLLFLLSIAALVFAIARPHTTVNVAKRKATVMLMTDTSGSMQADDVKPSRLVA